MKSKLESGLIRLLLILVVFLIGGLEWPSLMNVHLKLAVVDESGLHAVQMKYIALIISNPSTDLDGLHSWCGEPLDGAGNQNWCFWNVQQLQPKEGFVQDTIGIKF
jgi:hypothetical protein